MVRTESENGMAHLSSSSASASLPYSNDEDRWEAVLRRESAADDHFVYSVASTGVYCRPSCPSRLPNRENIRFYLAPYLAETAGFRACKRCRPNAAGTGSSRETVIGEACRTLQNANERPRLEDLAKLAGMSRFHFQRVFKQVTGVTPAAYFTQCRMRRLHAELRQGATVTQAIYDSGFNSNSRFYEKSSEMLGMTPKEFRGGGDTIRIKFAVGECLLGSILVAATEKGICAILLGEDPDALVKSLHAQFRTAELVGGDREFEEWVATVIGFVEDPGRGLNLPLDIRGTAFQQRVWQALRQVPAGSTVTYEEIAKRLGAPKSVRAVAGACASNTIAVAIPCHRVIRKSGGLSGYRWGVERKRALLHLEGTTSAPAENRISAEEREGAIAADRT